MILWKERPAKERLHTKNIHESDCSFANENAFRISVTVGKIGAQALVRAQTAERAAGFQVKVFWNRNRTKTGVLPEKLNANELVAVGVRERPQKDRIENG